MTDKAHPKDVFARTPVHGPAYSPSFKGLATLIMMAIVYYAYLALERHAAFMAADVKFALAAVGVMLVLSYWALLKSTTTIDGHGIAQSLMFKRPLAWDEIRSVRLVRSPSAVRLYVRGDTGAVVVYHAGNSIVSSAFALIARRYPPN